MNKILGIVVAFVIVAVGFLALAIERVPAGYMGVVYSVNGGVKGEPLGQGWHILAPTKKVVNYPISTESLYLSKEIAEGSEKDDSFNISSKDGKTVNVDAELSYRYDGERLNDVYKKFRGRKADDIANTFIRALREAHVDYRMAGRGASSKATFAAARAVAFFTICCAYTLKEGSSASRNATAFAATACSNGPP
jgi:regulator of protease activity HflC (stomatin/prohibitin superfamily)